MVVCTPQSDYGKYEDATRNEEHHSLLVICASQNGTRNGCCKKNKSPDL
jgi:hypothetical protein